MIWMVIVTTLLIIMGMGVMIGIVYNDHNDVRKRVEILEGEIMVLRDMLNKVLVIKSVISRCICLMSSDSVEIFGTIQ